MAPSEVYANARTLSSDTAGDNMTWSFQVDSGFYYLFRLHFCEISQNMAPHKRVFGVYINGHTAEHYADVIRWSYWGGFPVYKDYIVNFT